VQRTDSPLIQAQHPHLYMDTIPPDPTEMAVAEEHPSRNHLLTGILLLLVIGACTVASMAVVPLLLAILLSLMLAPAVRLLCNWRVPRVLATMLVLMCTLLVVGTLLLSLASNARTWLTRVPIAISRMELVLDKVRRPLLAATHASEQFTKYTNVDGDSKTQQLVEAGPSRMTRLLSATPPVLASMTVTLVLVFIFLLHGDALLRKFVELAPALHIKKDIVIATRSAQHELSTYIITITGINCVVGLLTASALWGLGVDDPLLWGGVVAVLNFMPFVGPMLSTAVLILVGFACFEAPLAALSVPGVFLALRLFEGQIATPMVVGRRLALDPVMVFLALILFGWMWGVVGLLLALPLMACLRIVAERIPAWNTLAKMLGA